MRRPLLLRGLALLLTSLLVGAFCQGLWGLFWLAFVWTFLTLLVFGVVAAALDHFAPSPFE